MAANVHYALIQADEDGDPIRWLDARDVQDIGQLMEDHGVTELLDELPPEDSRDPSYWHDGVAMLVEIRVLKVRPKERVTNWEIVADG